MVVQAFRALMLFEVERLHKLSMTHLSCSVFFACARGLCVAGSDEAAPSAPIVPPSGVHEEVASSMASCLLQVRGVGPAPKAVRQADRSRV